MHAGNQTFAKTLALLAILGHFATIVLAASPSLHCWLHGESAFSDHACAVVALLAGQIDHASAPALTVPRPAISDQEPLLAPPCFPDILSVDQTSARAPPVGDAC